MSRITTVEQLRNYMNTFEKDNTPTTDETIIWFNCIREAKSISEGCSLKDIASMLQEGIAPMNTLQSVQDTLKGWYDELADEDQHNLDELYLKCRVAEFYGDNEEHLYLESLMEPIQERIEESWTGQ